MIELGGLAGVGRPRGGPVVLVTAVGAATGSRPAAAALTCAGSEADRAGLLIDLTSGRAPRPALIATASACQLEERLAVHLPEAGVASRGQLCQLTLPADSSGLGQAAAALPAARDSVAVLHLPPQLLQQALAEPLPATGVLLRADLADDRSLTALVARELIGHGLRVAVLKRPLGWLAARTAPYGAFPAGGQALPVGLRQRLLNFEDRKFRRCYDGKDESEGERKENPRREQQGFTHARRWKEPHPANGQTDQ